MTLTEILDRQHARIERSRDLQRQADAKRAEAIEATVAARKVPLVLTELSGVDRMLAEMDAHNEAAHRAWAEEAVLREASYNALRP